MRRKNREIAEPSEIIDVLRRCNTVRIGLFNGEYPYVVPVSFGLDMAESGPVIYFHGAKVGLKAECIKQNKNVCVEADIFLKIEPTEIGITARYESVIGFGTISEACDEEKKYGIRKILEHYEYYDYPVDRCRGLANMAVYKIALSSLTGKHNLSGN